MQTEPFEDYRSLLFAMAYRLVRQCPSFFLDARRWAGRKHLADDRKSVSSYHTAASRLHPAGAARP